MTCNKCPNHMPNRRARSRQTGKKPTGRQGKPLTVYLSTGQAGRVDKVCRDRRVTKAEIVRYALDRLFKDMDTGQLELPFGLK